MSVAPAADLQTNILKVLAAGGAPMTPSSIAKALPVGGRPTPEALKGLLAQMTRSGRLARAPDNSDTYVAAPVEAWARGRLIEALGSGPQTEAMLKKSLTKHYQHLLDGLLAPLLAGGQTFRHPPLLEGGQPVYAPNPPDPLVYVAKGLDELMARLQANGFGAAALKAAALRHLGAAQPNAGVKGRSEPGLSSEPIIDAMHRLEPRMHDGAAVSIARLRETLSGRYDKGSFDAAMLSLLKRGILELQSHAWPARLTSEEQRDLIDNGQGGWFDSAALRRRSPA